MISPSQILERIDAFTLAERDQSFRTHLGASEIGRKCLREIWYRFRWVAQEKFDGRMLRLFSRGNREEAEIVRLLRGAGFEVHTPNEGNVEDFQFKDCGQHFAGTCDGTVLIPDSEDYAILECKTYSTERFKKLKQLGVQEADPVYYSQLQVYQGELQLSWALFFAVCKETDEIFTQWVPYDETHFHACLNKAELVLNSATPPERISNNPDTFTCRFCIFNQICHAHSLLPVSNYHCRNCRYSAPVAGGQWECQKGHTFGQVCEDYCFNG